MFTSRRQLGSALRLALARRPWIRWLAVATLSLGAAWLVFGQLRSVDDARRAWTEQRIVFVATHDHAPGDALAVEPRSLPEAAIPPAALVERPTGVTTRQHISFGEVVTRSDVSRASGPAAVANQGDVVVAVSDPLLHDAMSTVSIGLPVEIHSDGIVLAASARVVGVEGDVVFVAVNPVDAPGVSFAAQTRLASLAFLP